MKHAKKESREFKFIGKSLYFPNEEILVLADLHIGYEEYLNEWGVFIPRMQFKETMKELKRVFEEIKNVGKERKGRREKKIKEVVVLGDLKHEFGKISEQEWKEVKEVLDFLKKKSKKVVLVKGNHDTILEPIAKRKELKIRDFCIEKEICFLHGHKLFSECLDEKIKYLIMGHRHPAVMLADKYKKEKYKCFLVGKWRGKRVIILPSFFPFVEGSDIVPEYGQNRLFIPENRLRNFDVFILGRGEVYRFGKLKRII